MQTRLFKSGNSQAVRIPKELCFAAGMQDVDIERQGEALIIRPQQRRKLVGLGAKFAAFTPDFMEQGREIHEQDARDWD
ncbi:MAG: AbrB/MazE/SpoVT family DNA-binding domain-containing protein [Methylococcaceae bacterium]|nr:MAG: AbrB/MazE/SpoVT family DNA-binding domain-containing protein [Methylococcaceae bacterium]